MAASEKSKLTRPILLIALTLPLGLYFLLYLGAEQKFEQVPFTYTIQGGDTVYYRLPPFRFHRVAQADTVTEADVDGKILIVSLFSVDDDSLGKTTVLFGNLQRIYDNVDWDMNPPFVFVSINTGDSLAAVKAFQQNMETDPNHWWVLTGDRREVLTLAQQHLVIEEFAYETPESTPKTAQTVAMIDPDGRLRKTYVITDLQEERDVEEDLITLLRVDYPEEIVRMREGNSEK